MLSYDVSSGHLHGLENVREEQVGKIGSGNETSENDGSRRGCWGGARGKDTIRVGSSNERRMDDTILRYF